MHTSLKKKNDLIFFRNQMNSALPPAFMPYTIIISKSWLDSVECRVDTLIRVSLDSPFRSQLKRNLQFESFIQTNSISKNNKMFSIFKFFPLRFLLFSSSPITQSTLLLIMDPFTNYERASWRSLIS